MAEAEKVKFSERDYDLESKIASFVFGNGTTLEADYSSYTPEIQLQLGLHGLIQKVGDSYASAKGDYAKAVESASAVIEQLTAGQWFGTREGVGAPRLGELADAIARIKGVEVDKARVAVEAATDEQRKAWRSNAKVKATIAQLRMEKAMQDLQAAGDTEVEVSL